VIYYKQALLYHHNAESAKHNLELALRELDKHRKNEPPEQESPSGEGSGRKEEGKDQPDAEDREENPDRGSEGTSPDRKASEDEGQRSGKGDKKSGRDKENQQEMTPRTEGGLNAEEEGPKDFSGDLKPNQALPGAQEDNDTPPQPVYSLDKKKAEALLDNIKEDRSRFLRFQVPKEKAHGVRSGKDW
jgi:Ca-activated chloride channel family protein